MIRAHVVSDASFCPKQKVAGWAAYVILEGGLSKGYSGPLPSTLPGSKRAEAHSAAIGVGIAYRTHGANTVLVYSDDLTVGQFLWEFLPEDVVKNCWVGYRHISGHTLKPDLASLANEWCDQEAKKHMRFQRI